MAILQLGSDTLAGTPVTGQVEYNGQMFYTDSNASRGQVERIVQDTAQASTSGTSIDFISIPAWVKKITVMFSGVSTNGTSAPLIQIGDSGGIENTGYLGSSTNISSSSNYTTGFGILSSVAANVFHGRYLHALPVP